MFPKSKIPESKEKYCACSSYSVPREYREKKIQNENCEGSKILKLENSENSELRKL
jgi:hypothetical protein